MQQLTHRRFIDRGSETAFLKDRYATTDPEFLVIYGKVQDRKDQTSAELFRE